MPNPKVGTVTMDVTQAVKDAKGGAVEFRVEKAGIVHAGVGKASFEEKAIAANVRALIDSVVKAKPAGAKGNYLKKISISSTMGPGVKIALASVGQAGRQHRRTRFPARVRRKTCPRPRESLWGLNKQSQRRRGENRTATDASPPMIGFEPWDGRLFRRMPGNHITGGGKGRALAPLRRSGYGQNPKSRSVEEP